MSARNFHVNFSLLRNPSFLCTPFLYKWRFFSVSGTRPLTHLNDVLVSTRTLYQQRRLAVLGLFPVQHPLVKFPSEYVIISIHTSKCFKFLWAKLHIFVEISKFIHEKYVEISKSLIITGVDLSALDLWVVNSSKTLQSYILTILHLA